MARKALAKRGPVSGKLANLQGQLKPLSKVSPKDVIDRVLAEESTKDIAASYGVTRSALNQWLLQHAEDDWRAAQVIRATRRKDEAEDAMETAPDALSLARARELLKAAQWDLERVCRRIYGTDQPPAGLQTVHIHVGITRQSPVDAEQHGQVIDGTTLNNT